MARKIPPVIRGRISSFYDAGQRGHRPPGIVKGSIDYSSWMAGVDDPHFTIREDVIRHNGGKLELWKRLGSGISWCHATFNWWTGCVKCSPGCKNCYAEFLVDRRGGGRNIGGVNKKIWGRKAPRPRTGRSVWQNFQKFRRLQDDPAWRIEVGLKDGERPRVFVGSLMDIGEARDDDMLAIVADGFDVVREADDVDWLFLTKRPQNVRSFLPSDWGNGWPHCWWMTSIESGLTSCKDAELQAPVLTRVEHLLDIPARFHGVSYEPAIGPLATQLRPFMGGAIPVLIDGLEVQPLPAGDFWWSKNPEAKLAFIEPRARVDWCIYGGESGKGFRPEGVPSDRQLWARDMRDACRETGVAFFHKQGAASTNEMGVELDGEIIHQYPGENQCHT